MEKVILDTNVVIGYFSGDTRLEAILANTIHWYLPVPVVGELLFGARNSARASENIALYQQFIADCHLLTLDAEVADVYSQIRIQLKKDGHPIPENDVWIAATARANQLPLVTFDKHFQYVSGLQLVEIV
ncbi:MAG: type II toxin-antitoxin system VapC family toxin [Bacteroidia bacterium]|nr:type II toxin-antitoxin system VapC family toxin [Bacteroidia bacterium]